MTDKQRAPATSTSYMPDVRQVSAGDIWTALKSGVADFAAAPLFGVFFGGICASVGLLFTAALTVYGMTWLVIPAAIGFPLVGPFVAIGLYEVSRRRAAGTPLKWKGILLVIFRHREQQFVYMGIVILCIFWVWIFLARILFAVFLGSKSFSSLMGFAEIVFMTSPGLGFLAFGTVIGAILAFVLFSATVIAMPMLIDRDIDVVSAVITSFNAVFKSPVPMIGWGAVIAVLVVLAMLPAFAGLVVVLPVLGHATWHLYTKVIVGAGDC